LEQASWNKRIREDGKRVKEELRQAQAASIAVSILKGTCNDILHI